MASNEAVNEELTDNEKLVLNSMKLGATITTPKMLEFRKKWESVDSKQMNTSSAYRRIFWTRHENNKTADSSILNEKVCCFSMFDVWQPSEKNITVSSWQLPYTCFEDPE